ncbi:hypothetical protein [Halomonas heilongjiangensis]|uniref:hypothetical protein n=1 Tax=Halomonas heilongjiangensis TaxID=1387883 RepID=UPI001F0C2DF9|nr:hypothetical protein [Halomonas heilongjiangensis]
MVDSIRRELQATQHVACLPSGAHQVLLEILRQCHDQCSDVLLGLGQRRLLPLSQLRAFEAAARHRSFKLATE